MLLEQFALKFCNIWAFCQKKKYRDRGENCTGKRFLWNANTFNQHTSLVELVWWSRRTHQLLWLEQCDRVGLVSEQIREMIGNDCCRFLSINRTSFLWVLLLSIYDNRGLISLELRVNMVFYRWSGTVCISC